MNALTDRHIAGARAHIQPTALGYASAFGAVSNFKQRMAAHGWVVDASRMLRDHAYALEQVALGHTSECARLRAAAMRVFELYPK